MRTDVSCWSKLAPSIGATLALLCAALAFPLAVARADKRALVLEDYHQLQDVTEPAFAPRGDAILYTVSTDNLDSNAAVSDLWRVSWRGGAPFQLTHTPFASEWLPRWRADGAAIAFLSDRGAEENAQIWLMPAQGGDARQLTHVKGGIKDFVWAPNGKQIAFLAEDAAPEAAKDSRGKDKPAAPLVVTRFQFKEDGRDYLTDRWQHLYFLDVESGAVTLLTPGAHDEWLPSWSPDGKQIAFVSKRLGDVDRNLNFDIWLIPPVAGAEPRRVSTFDGDDGDWEWESRPQWSPDSRKLVWLTSGEDKWIYYAPWQLSVADLASGKVTTPARIDRCFYKPHWSKDGKYIYALIEQSRNTWLARIDPATDQVRYLTSGNRFALDFDMAPDGRIVLLDSDDVTPYELSAVEAQRRPLTHHNAFLDDIDIRATEDFSYTSDGHRIDGLVLKPAGFKTGVRYPAIVRLHGGPAYQFSHEFLFEWQLFAAKGYAVIGINPRGSTGRGFDFSRAVHASNGGVDVQDVLMGVDYMVQQGWIDPERLGVGGRSYGSLLTNYVIASDTRFKAAVSGSGSGNWLGTYGVDEYARENELELGTPWKNLDAYVRVSYPFLHADHIHTPTLFYCAMKDFNVPCQASEQMYQALRSLNVPTELVLYPNQNHAMTVPGYYVDRMRRALEWYDGYLKRP
jgi:dipeptidyl aminopeptidase/acylaminoacyl peptidase